MRAALCVLAALCFSHAEGVDDVYAAYSFRGKRFPCRRVRRSEPFSLTLQHINDHHSHLESAKMYFRLSQGLQLNLSRDAFTEKGVPAATVEIPMGGFAKIATILKTPTPGKNVLKLHAGDAITGTLFFTLFEGEADAEVMNQVCFDALTLGNHEFDKGDAGLAKFLDFLKDHPSCRTSVLGANVIPGPSSPLRNDYIRPYMIKSFNGHRVAVIGVDVAKRTKEGSSPDPDTMFLDETATAQRYIDELTTRGIDKIIVMGHYGHGPSVIMAQKLRNVDIVVGGDSHTLLGDSTFQRFGFTPNGDYPYVTRTSDNKMVCVVQAWHYSQLIGELDVDFDANGEVSRCGGQPILPIGDKFVFRYNNTLRKELTGDDHKLILDQLLREDEVRVTADDPAVAAAIAKYNDVKAELEQQIIGSNADDLCLDGFPGAHWSNLCLRQATYKHGSDITTLVAKAFMTVTKGADIGLQNAGGVRMDLPSGEVSIASAQTLLPFGNVLVTFNMTGADLKTVIEDALSYPLDEGGSAGAFPYAFGMRYTLDLSMGYGSRVSNVEINKRGAGSWVPLDDTAYYTIVTNNYIGGGKDGYAMFGTYYTAGKYVNTFLEYMQAFVDFVRAEGTLTRQPDEFYSTQRFINRNGCDHSLSDTC